VGIPCDPCPEFPPGLGAGIDGKGSGRLPLGEAKHTALGYQSTGECPLIDRLRVIAEELDKGRDESNFGLPLPHLPVVNRPGTHAEERCRLLLGDREHEPATADVVA
jgi:hypothetical protein